ncbi:MAG TPA: zinc ribbon domain-containing protein [Ktedonosporobacter sp.]|nr:zinc ribbon domain-containing protein [Ktedonosporobacter sp.]
MDRAIIARLNPTPEQAQVLKSTIEEHTACFNAVATFGFRSKCCNGVELHKVDPRHTSQMCSHCSYHHRANRRSQSLFLCRHRGYCLNADLNACIDTSLLAVPLSTCLSFSLFGVRSKPLCFSLGRLTDLL